MQLWAPCASDKAGTLSTKGFVKASDKLNLGRAEWLRPAGWTVLSTLWAPVAPKKLIDTLPVPASKTTSPIATILTKGSHLTVLIRGTQTVADMLTGESGE